MCVQLNDVSKHSNVVVIIGNGFDLSMGFKTSYNDFVESEFFKCILKKNEKLLLSEECLDFWDNEKEMVLNDNGLAGGCGK